MLRGRLHKAGERYEQAGRVLQAQEAAVFSGVEHAGLGDLQREWNHLEEATVEVQKGLEEVEPGDHIMFLTDVYQARVRLALAQKDWDSAWRYLDKYSQVVHRSTASVEIELLSAWRARVHLAQGDLAQAGLWAETKQAAGVGPWTPRQEWELLMLARIRLAQGKVDYAASLLERIRTAAEESGRRGRALEAQMLQALADQAAGKDAQALERLAEVLAGAEPEGYMRLFLDEGQAMARLLQLAVARGIVPSYSSKLLAALETESRSEQPGPAAAAGTPLVEPLSERELQVLRFVAAGLSNQEIADRLVVSIRTVKKHAQNIYGRLGVNSRTRAVASARELNLL